MAIFKQTLITLTLACAASTAYSQEYNNNPNIYAGGVDYLFDDEHNQKDDLGFLLGGEIPIAERWGLAAEYWSLDSDIQGFNSDSDVDYLRVGGNYHLMPRNKWQPYLSVGLGRLNIDPNVAISGTDHISADLGAGFKYMLSKDFFLRGDVKALLPSGSPDIDFAFGLSIGYNFGAKPKRAVAAAPAPAVKEEAPVVRTPAAPAPKDSDMDGVFDGQDNCPRTPTNLAVDDSGCPILDVSQMRQTLAVNFDTNQAVVKADYEAELSAFAAFMKTYSNTSVTIEGHTDSDGKAEYNQALSERRAQAIRAELINRYGIAASRVSAIGYGEDRPIASNNTSAGKASNRRIEAEVTATLEEQRKR